MLSRSKSFNFKKKEGENDTELRGICRVQMGDFETVKPQMFRLVRGQTLLKARLYHVPEG